MTVLPVFSQTITIPATKAKEITKGLISEEKLRKENKILLLELENYKGVIIKKDTLLFNLKQQLLNAENNIKDLYKILDLEKEKSKLLESTTNLKSWLWGGLGTLTGVVVGLSI